MFLGFALSSALPSYHHGHRGGATGVDEGVLDLAPARDQIWSVVTGAEVGRESKSGLYYSRGGSSAVN